MLMLLLLSLFCCCRRWMSSDVVDEDAAAGGAKCALDPASDYPAFGDADYRMEQKKQQK